MNVTWLETEAFVPTASRSLQDANIVLDIGCGIQPQRFIRPQVHICCEPFDQYVEHLQELVRKEPDRNFVVVRARWDEAVRLFPPKSVDTIFLHDVIEHLEKDEALRLLKETEPIARRQMAVFTPLGFMPQHHPDGKDAWGLDGGSWQEHKSGWQPEDFDEGWDIYATKVFHTTDSMGRELETPFGAFWAIKTFPVDERTAGVRLSNRQRIYAMVDKVLNVVWKVKDMFKGKR